MRKYTSFAVVVCALTVSLFTSAVAAQRGPGAGAGAQPFHLIVNDNVAAPAATFLTPADPLVAETITGPDLFTIPIPADRLRTYLQLVVNCSFTWHQIPTGVPLQFNSSFRVRFSSAVLPAPGVVEVTGFGSGIVLHGGSTVSVEDITTNTPFQRTVFYDAGFVAPSIQAAFPALTPAQVQQLSATLFQSDMTITLAPLVTMRSVQNVRYSPLRLVQVFGD